MLWIAGTISGDHAVLPMAAANVYYLHRLRWQ